MSNYNIPKHCYEPLILSVARDIVSLMVGDDSKKPVSPLEIMTPTLFHNLSVYARVHHTTVVRQPHVDSLLTIAFASFFKGHLMIHFQDDETGVLDYREFIFDEETGVDMYYPRDPDDPDRWEDFFVTPPDTESGLASAISAYLAQTDWNKPKEDEKPTEEDDEPRWWDDIIPVYDEEGQEWR